MEEGKGNATDVAGSARANIQIQGRGNISYSTDPCNNVQEDYSVRKRKTGDDGHIPCKRMRHSNHTNPTDHTAMSVEDWRHEKGQC